MKRLAVISVAVFAVFALANAREAVFVSYENADTTVSVTRCDPNGRAANAESFRATKLIAPGALMGAGVFGTYSDWYRQTVNLPARDYAANIRDGNYCKADGIIQYVPAVMHAGVGFISEPSHCFLDRALAQATAWASMGILVNAMKYTIREERPDGSARNSFPSGHTATAFMGAELVRLEYGPWWGAGAYSVATVTALLRVYNERHWTSDLFGGAAIGVLSAHVGYWLLPWEKRILHLDRQGSPALAAIPYSTGRSSGLMIQMAF